MLENYVAIDLEMTGLQTKTDIILEVGAVRVREGNAAETYEALLYTDRTLSEKVVELTGITQEMAMGGRNREEAMAEFFSFIGEDVLVGQNIIFDYSFLKQWAVNHRFPFERTAVDTLKLARKFLPEEEKKTLESLCAYFGIKQKNAHRALYDAFAAYEVLEQLKMRFMEGSEAAFVPKPLKYKPKRQTPATDRQKEYLRRYAKVFGLALPEHMEELTRSEASRLMDRWILTYGKLPGQDAKEGKE